MDQSTQKRALVIEKMPCHQEIIPSWIWALNKLGYQVDLMVRAPQHRDITTEMRDRMGLKFNIVTGKTIGLDSYDIVLNNSLYPDANVEHLRPGNRTLSVLHRLPAVPYNYKDWKGLRDPDHRILALGRHMHSTLKLDSIQSEWTPPIFFGSPGTVEQRNPRVFLIQGTMERFRRNYGCLAMLMNIFGPSHPQFTLNLMGDGGVGVLKWLAPQIQGDLKKRIVGIMNVDYSQFFEQIRGAGWMIPCVDETFEHEYFDRKITSSIMLAVGTATPLIVHERLALLYGLKHQEHCLTYADAESGLREAFQLALEMSWTEYLYMAEALMAFRQQCLRQLFHGFTELTKIK